MSLTELVLLFEVGVLPPHDGVRRMERFNLLSALGTVRCQDLQSFRTRFTRRPREDTFLPGQIWWKV